jgi:DNA-binding beta-propeller fold protein YncE
VIDEVRILHDSDRSFGLVTRIRPAVLSRMFSMRIVLAALAALLAATLAHTATLSTFAGNGAKGFAGDGAMAKAAQLADPGGIAIAPDGSLYICDTANHRIRRVSTDGKITTVAGTGEKGWSGDGGPAVAAKLAEPYEVRFDAKGNIYWVGSRPRPA